MHRIRAEPAGPILAALCATLGAERPVADLAERAAAEQLAAWFTGRWAPGRRRRSTAP
jgi:hypothetical protein